MLRESCCKTLKPGVKAQKDKIILGIDPGTNLMGYGVIQAGGKSPCYLDMGVVNLQKTADSYMKLRLILERTLPRREDREHK